MQLLLRINIFLLHILYDQFFFITIFTVFLLLQNVKMNVKIKSCHAPFFFFLLLILQS
jgi:hypothetical protein